ncbi:MAG: hypothetical protein ACE5HE_10630 [Phycisphaerae bacterium]
MTNTPKLILSPGWEFGEYRKVNAGEWFVTDEGTVRRAVGCTLGKCRVVRPILPERQLERWLKEYYDETDPRVADYYEAMRDTINTVSRKVRELFPHLKDATNEADQLPVCRECGAPPVVRSENGYS